jgi:hypothetical protein
VVRKSLGRCTTGACGRTMVRQVVVGWTRLQGDGVGSRATCHKLVCDSARAAPTTAALACATWAEEFQLWLLNNQTNAMHWTPRKPGSTSMINLGWEANSSIVVDFAVLGKALSYGSDHRVLQTVLHISGKPKPAVTETKYCVTDYHVWTEVYHKVVNTVNPVPDPSTTD